MWLRRIGRSGGTAGGAVASRIGSIIGTVEEGGGWIGREGECDPEAMTLAKVSDVSL